MLQRKLLSIALVMIMIISTSMVSPYASENTKLTTGDIYLSLSSMNLYNTSWDQYHDIIAHIWNVETNEELTKDGSELRGWSVSGNQNKLKFDLRSYGITLDPNTQYRIVFENKSIHNSTHPLLFDISCIGETVYCGNSRRDYYEYYGKNRRQEYIARWGWKPDANEDNAPEIVIREEASYYGDAIFVYGERFSKFTNARKMLSDYIANSLDAYLLRNSGTTAQYVIDDIASRMNYQEEQNYYQTSLYREDVEEVIFLLGKDVDWFADKSSLDSDKYLNKYFEGGYYLRSKNINDNTYFVLPKYKFTLESETGNYLLSNYDAEFEGYLCVARYTNGTFVNVSEDFRMAPSFYKRNNNCLFYFSIYQSPIKLYYNSEDELKSLYNYQLYSVQRYSSAEGSSSWGFSFPENIPRIRQMKLIKNGIKIMWNKVEGISKYRVYSKENDKWIAIGETNANSYIDRNVTSGKVYSYTICGISDDSREEKTTYLDSPWWSLKFLKAPHIQNIQYENNEAIISWNEVEGIVNYKVLVENDGHWEVVGTTSDTTFSYTGNITDTARFSVACASYDGYSITSSYDRGEEIIGDTNGSGEIEIVDATFIQRSLSYIRTPYTKDELLRGDVDDSGELEIIDATAIQYYLANMKTLYNIGESI